MPKPSQPRHLSEILETALLRTRDGRVPPPQLMADWQRAAGQAMARRARPVCLKPDGVLVVAVDGSVWRQEVSLASPQLARTLAEAGHAVSGIKAVLAPSPPPPAPPAPQVELDPDDLARAERAVAKARDPELRAALARAVRAQITAEKSGRS